MKITNTSWTSKMFLFALAALFMASCDDLEDIVIDPVTVDSLSQIYSTLEVTDDEDESITIFASDYISLDSTEFSVLVTFNDSDTDMQRLYITENKFGEGEEAYELGSTNSNFDFDIDLKADGSIDLDKGLDGTFTFLLTFPIDVDLDDEGTIVYSLWATSGRGDYRDDTKRLTVGVGEIVVQYGTENPATILKEYTTKILAAPTADLTSESFISLVDGELYEIADGEEYAAFWDFGYYYGASGVSDGQEASLASTSAFEEAYGFIDVAEIAGTTELNNCYFSESSMVFEDASTSIDLNGIATPSSQSITNLSEGDVIEFEDAYGHKGLIEVSEIYLGNSGNGYDSDAYIEINVKVQP